MKNKPCLSDPEPIFEISQITDCSSVKFRLYLKKYNSPYPN